MWLIIIHKYSVETTPYLNCLSCLKISNEIVGFIENVASELIGTNYCNECCPRENSCISTLNIQVKKIRKLFSNQILKSRKNSENYGQDFPQEIGSAKKVQR